jgi:hypothetical protein
MVRARLALVGYWTLFIVGPTAVITVWLVLRGHSVLSTALALPLLLILMLLGERGLRVWNRLWRVHW